MKEDIGSIKQFYNEEGLRINYQYKVYKASDPVTLQGKLRKFWIDAWLNDILSHDSYFLDVGCAEGMFVVETSEKIKLSAGLDIPTPRLKKAVKHASGRNNTHFLIADATYLPFRNNSFDACLCSETLEHIPNYISVFNELVRVCNGELIITIPNYNKLYLILFKILKFLGLRKRPSVLNTLRDGHLHIIRDRALDSIALKNGFRRVKTIYCAAIFAFPLGYPSSAIWRMLNRASPLGTKFLSNIVNKLDKILDRYIIFKFSASYLMLRYRFFHINNQ